MSKDLATTTEATPAPTKPGELVLRADTRAQLAVLFGSVPELGDAGMESIVLQILQADDWSELDKPWNTTSSEHMIGVEHRIDEITRMPSRFAGGTGIFLVIRGQDNHGQDVVWTTSAVAIVVQLARAWVKGWIPGLVVELAQTDETRNGFRAQFLRVLGKVDVNAATQQTS